MFSAETPHAVEFSENMVKKLKYGTFSDVLLAPERSLIPIYGGGLVEPHRYPRFCQHLRYGFVSNKPISLPNQPVPELPLVANKPYIFGGVYMHHFGRFVAQSIHRLWIASHPMYEDHTVLFVARPSEMPLKPHFDAIMKIFGVQNWRIINSACTVEKLIIAEQAKIFGLPSRRHYAGYLNDLSYRNKLIKPHIENKKIAILRQHLGARHYVAERHLETYLTTQGYSIFHPEKHQLHEQLAVLSNAEKIIIADGSACHLFDMLPPVKANVAFLSRSKFSRLGRTSVKPKVNKFFNFTNAAPLIIPTSKTGKKRTVKALLFAPLPELVHFLKDKGFLPKEAPAMTNPPYLIEATRYAQNWSASLPRKYQQTEYLKGLIEKAEHGFRIQLLFSSRPRWWNRFLHKRQ